LGSPINARQYQTQDLFWDCQPKWETWPKWDRELTWEPDHPIELPRPQEDMGIGAPMELVPNWYRILFIVQIGDGGK
jgi:hypothetical protein